MRKLLGLCGLVLAGMLLSGCATVTRTAEENTMNMHQIADLDARQVADDWNSIWFADRQTRLTRWNTR